MRQSILPLLLALALFGCNANGSALPAEYRSIEVPRARLDSPGSRLEGRAIYLEHCALCHGVRADGRGVRRNLSSRAVAFTDTTWRERSSPRRVFFVIREGVRGTAMAGWKILDERETWDLVSYVLSVAEPSRPAG